MHSHPPSLPRQTREFVNRPAWGIDLGGTKIEGVVTNPDSPLEPLARIRVDTERDRGYEHILSQVARVVRELAAQTGLRPEIVGIGHPGTTVPRTGLLKNSNTVCMNGKPLEHDLARVLGTRVRAMNDANCFALAEAVMGAGRGADVVFGVILGTGVGGGIVVRGEIVRGRQGLAGEWGHNVLEKDGPLCYCGKHGCIESMISGPALSAFYEGLTQRRLSFKEICAKLADNESAAQRTIDRFIDGFGLAIAQVINILDPDVIVLGGGLSKFDLLYPRIIEATSPHVFTEPPLETKFLRHEIGDSAGVFGAALLGACYHAE